MMCYEEFKKIVVECFLKYMPESFRDGKVQVCKCEKNNQILDGLYLVKEGQTMSPMIHLNYMYEDYLECKNLHTVLANSAKDMCRTFERLKKVHISLDNTKEKVIFQLVGTEQNRELLSHVPHQEFLNLSIIYRILLDMRDDEIQSSIVTYENLKVFQLREDQLFDLAKANMRRLLPAVALSFQDILPVIPDIHLLPEDENIFMVSNPINYYGAVYLLYEDVLQDVAEELEDDLCIIPSSVNELIVASAHSNIIDSLAEAIRVTNSCELQKEELLSDSVYYYDREDKRITLFNL